MKYCLRLILILTLFVLTNGCGEDAPKIDKGETSGVNKRVQPGIYTSEKSVLIKNMAVSDVIARVNGVDITKKDYLARRSLMDKLFRIKKKLPITGKDDKARKHLKSIEQSIPIELVRRELMKQGADKAGIQYDPKKANSLFKSTVRRLGCPRETLKSLENRLGKDDYSLLITMINEDVRAEALLIHSATNDLTSVGTDDVERYKKKVVKFNEKSQKNNDKSRKKALKFKERVIGGDDFEATALKVAQVVPQYAKEWDTFQLMEFDKDDPLRKWLEGAKVGDLSDPIDLDDGLAIVKLVAKEKAEVPAEMGPVYEYKLVRCTFYAYQYAIEQTDDEIRDMLLEEKRAAARECLGMKLVSEAVIEFPNGQNFFANRKMKGLK